MGPVRVACISRSLGSGRVSFLAGGTFPTFAILHTLRRTTPGSSPSPPRLVYRRRAEVLGVLKEGKDRKPLYVYAHNGSKFDAIEAMHSILANDGEVPTDQLESNGKFISFA